MSNIQGPNNFNNDRPLRIGDLSKRETNDIRQQNATNRVIADQKGPLSNFRDIGRVLAVLGTDQFVSAQTNKTKRKGLTNLDSRKANPDLKELLAGSSRLGDLAA